jgi:adenine-specific DNA-methyltransferase
VAAADSIGKAAATFDPEAAAYAIGLIYIRMLPPSYRASYGIYYTPPQLTARLLAQATAAGTNWARCMQRWA